MTEGVGPGDDGEAEGQADADETEPEARAVATDTEVGGEYCGAAPAQDQPEGADEFGTERFRAHVIFPLH